jgi:hypothetical protein
MQGDLTIESQVPKTPRSIRLTVPAIFGVLVFLIKLMPPPMSELFQIFTALFITIATLTVHRLGGATYTCLIAGLLDAIYTGVPVAFVLFAIRGGTFDLALSVSTFWAGLSTVKVATSSILSSLLTGFAAYWTLVEWLGIAKVPLVFFMVFIVISGTLSGLGSVMGLNLWRRVYNL